MGQLGSAGMLMHRLRNRSNARTGSSSPAETVRVEERCRSLANATKQWRSLLQEMEHAGQSGEPRYEAYYRAYLQTRERQRRVDLELFNLQQRLLTK